MSNWSKYKRRYGKELAIGWACLVGLYMVVGLLSEPRPRTGLYHPWLANKFTVGVVAMGVFWSLWPIEQRDREARRRWRQLARSAVDHDHPDGSTPGVSRRKPRRGWRRRR